MDIEEIKIKREKLQFIMTADELMNLVSLYAQPDYHTKMCDAVALSVVNGMVKHVLCDEDVEKEFVAKGNKVEELSDFLACLAWDVSEAFMKERSKRFKSYRESQKAGGAE